MKPKKKERHGLRFVDRICRAPRTLQQVRRDLNSYLSILETDVFPFKLPTYDYPPFTSLVRNSRASTIIPETFLKDFVKLYSFTFTLSALYKIKL